MPRPLRLWPIRWRDRGSPTWRWRFSRANSRRRRRSAPCRRPMPRNGGRSSRKRASRRNDVETFTHLEHDFMSVSSGMPGASVEPGITLTHDTPELAAMYEEVSIRQFENGKQLVSALNISSGQRVLDIGAGTGRLAAYVAKIVGPSGCVVGIDPLPLRVEIAQSKAIGNFEARVGRAENLFQFDDGTFDGSAAAWPVVAQAQQTATPVVGWLSSRNSQTDDYVLPAFRRGLNG